VRARLTGPIVVLVILGVVILFLVLNLNPKGWNARGPKPDGDAVAPPPVADAAGPARRPAGFREYPIGEEVERNHMRIAALWLPPIQMDGMPDPSSAMIHLEADIHATAGNPNGFAKDEFVPYLKVHYTITPLDGGSSGGAPPPGTMMPMVASDGLHYGTSIELPKAGRYKLTYRIEPPSAGGLGRHSDAATGVAPWWQPFEVTFDWDYPGPP
jgi:uncharacterized protein involved in high-affinity Fe2+ transport